MGQVSKREMDDVGSFGVVALQREVLVGLEGVVRKNLDLLLEVDKSWQPTDFLPDLGAEDWMQQVKVFRDEAAAMSDEVLVVLVGDMVTEEALPSYAVSLNLIAEDVQGTSAKPWAKWLRGWTAEENRHGDLLNAFLRLTGRVDMRSVEITVQHLIAEGFDPRAESDMYAGLVYTSFQERATKISHNNVGRLAVRDGNSSLGKICRRIAGDEARHETFYTRMMGEVFELDPAGGMLTMAAMFKRVIAMPGKLMFDGQDPDLFEHFSTVAQRLGVYTTEDYADVVQHLVETWKLGERKVSGRAAKAQEYLCRHAEKIESMSEAVAERVAAEPKVKFSWVHGRKV